MWSIAEVQYSSVGLNLTQIIITLYAADFLMTLIYWGEKDLTPKQQNDSYCSSTIQKWIIMKLAGGEEDYIFMQELIVPARKLSQIFA